MATIADEYRGAKKLLSAVTREAEAEAGAILAHVYGLTPGAVFMRFLHEGTGGKRIGEIVGKRLSGMPLAYALGEKNFSGRDFDVDERVLIPRSDTEQVVEHAVKAASQNGYQTALDLCCGSGCIGITLLLESGLKTVYMSDISPDALDVARKNAARLVPHKTSVFLCGDLFEPVDFKVDMIVCNPPYIAADEYEDLEAQVREYEPRSALTAGRGGYAFYERLARECGAFLTPGGTAVFEIGSTQSVEVVRLLKAAGFDRVDCGCDLAGRPRFVSCVMPKTR